MFKLFACRRTFVAFVSLGILAVLGWRGMDVAMAVATVAVGIAGANAGQKIMRSRGGDV